MWCLFLFPLCSLAENQVTFRKTYSRGDDDLAYTYRTAYLRLSFGLTRAANEFDAKVLFLADLTTEEAQGFAESVRFGMREAKREYRAAADESWKTMEVAKNPVLFKFVRVTPQGTLVPDAATQAVADGLSNNALQNGQAVPGNRREAMNKTLGGTFSLGNLSEGYHQGTIFVQQLVGQQPSQTDADISVRHLIKWSAIVKDGKIIVDIRDGRMVATNATASIAAPSWDGTVRPHRALLISDDVIVDGKTYLTNARLQPNSHGLKSQVLQEMDPAEFKREYNRSERKRIRRGQQP